MDFGSWKNVQLFTMMAWSIWMQRNQVRLLQPVYALHQLAQLSSDRCNEFLAVLTILQAVSLSIHDTWRPPPSDWMKINFDGATLNFLAENKAGIGVVVKDSSSMVS